MKLSIRNRLILLAAVLLLVMTVSSVYTRIALHQSLIVSEKSNGITRRMSDVFSVRAAFNDLRYWQADLAASQSNSAHTHAIEARKRLAAALVEFATDYPDEARQIKLTAAKFNEFARQAVEYYRNGNHSMGDYHLAQARRFGLQGNALLGDVQRRLVHRFLEVRASLLPPFAFAASVATVLTALAVLVGSFLTFVTLRSILKPLNRIVRAVHGLTSDNHDVEIPPRSGDELGRVTDALQLLRQSLKERDHLARETERQRKTLSDAIESIAEGFSLYNSSGNLVLANQRFRDIHPAYAALAETHASFSDVLRVNVAQAQSNTSKLQEWRERQGHSSSRIERFYDGRWMRISERQTHEGGFTVVYTEITELRKQQEELERARDEAQRATQIKSRFLANMSHELRTPLNAIIGYSQILQEELVESDHVCFLQDAKKIEGAGRHLLALINDILDLSKIEAERMEVYREVFDIEDLISDVVVLVRPLATRNDNNLSIKFATDIGCVVSDITKVKQTVLNLLSNALKFTQNGTVELLVERRGIGKNSVVAFVVSDTGIGMNEEQMDQLFQAFTQVGDPISRRYEGTGLGLAISRSFARMLGGDLTVTSKIGEGSCFVFTLPLQIVDGD